MGRRLALRQRVCQERERRRAHRQSERRSLARLPRGMQHDLDLRARKASTQAWGVVALPAKRCPAQKPHVIVVCETHEGTREPFLVPPLGLCSARATKRGHVVEPASRGCPRCWRDRPQLPEAHGQVAQFSSAATMPWTTRGTQRLLRRRSCAPLAQCRCLLVDVPVSRQCHHAR